MKDIIKLGLILFTFCVLAASALMLTDQVTAAPIQKQIDQANELARKGVFPEADSFEPLAAADLDELKADFKILQEVYFAKKGSDIIGYVVKTTPSGFSGAIEITTGISVDAKLTGVRIGSMTETPGLGDLAKKPDFYEQYTGKSTGAEIGVNKSTPGENEIQALTGATITSRAVTLGVNTAVQVVEFIK